MRLGLLPSQQRALQRTLKKARAFDRFRQRTRRQFLWFGALASVATVGAFLGGRRTAGPADVAPKAGSSAIDPRLALAHRLASRSDADLWDGAATFLVVLDANRSDRALWMGFARLARMAIERDGVDATRLAQRLLRSAEAATLPEFVVPLLGPLRERAR